MFENGKQKEVPNPWIGKDSWLVPTDVTYTINFGEISVVSRMYDINVYGERERISFICLMWRQLMRAS